MENIAILAGTQNTASLTQFSRLLYAALHAIQPAALITSADRHRVSTLASQEGVQQTVLVGDSFAAGWNEKCLDVVGTAGRRAKQSDAVLLVVNVCDTPLSAGDYELLSAQLCGIRREIVFLRESEDEVSEAFYERKIEEWKQVLYAESLCFQR